MDTLAFLQTVLPSSPIYYAIKISPDTGARHKAFTDLEKLAAAFPVMESQLATGENLYFACSGYKEAYTVREDGKKEWRSDRNWAGAKSFWVDIDVGKADGYHTQYEAFHEIRNKFIQYQIPTPLFLSSGNGFHMYWVMDRDMTNMAEWKSYASLIKAVLMGIGVRIDPTKTADPKAILRPLGTFNNKNPDKPKLVRLLSEKLVHTPQLLDTFIQLFKQIAQRNNIHYNEISEFDLLETPDYARSTKFTLDYSLPCIVDAERIEQRCKQMEYIAQTGGDVAYPVWFLALGLSHHVTDGEYHAHRWSNKHPNYSEENTNRVRANWNVKGAPTCDEFKEKNPDGCRGCVHKVNSPKTLGLFIPVEAPDVSHLEPEVAKQVVEAVPELPEGYRSHGGKMYRVGIVDGEEQFMEFCRGLLYITGRQRGDGDTFSTTWRMHPPHKDDAVIEFVLPNGLLNSKKDLVKKLGEHDILLAEHEGVLMVGYLRASVEKMRIESKAKSIREHFGWQLDGSFLYGNELYSPDGSVKQVAVSNALASFLGTFFTPPQGSLQGYMDALHNVYNRPTMEPFQYVICSAFGSLLNPFVGDTYSGIMLAFAGTDSGRGKTSVSKAAMLGFGSVNASSSCMIVGDGKGQGATANARVLIMSTLRNIPVIFDEFSNKEPDEIRQLCYEVANGASKSYATKDRSLVTGATFQMSPIMTGNTNFHESISIGKGKSAAESVRLLQIYIDNFHTVDFNTEDFGVNYVGKQLMKMQENSGWLGREFVKYVITHKQEVSDLLHKYSEDAARVVSNSAHRFFRYHVACTLTAAEILCEKMGVLKFDNAILQAFSLKMLRYNVQAIVGQVETDWETAFADMVNVLVPQTICTKDYHDGRLSVAEVVPHTHKNIAGRYILGCPNMKAKEWERKLLLTVSAVKEYCKDNRLDRVTLENWARDNKYLIEFPDNRHNITKGTNIPAMHMRAYVFDMEKVDMVLNVDLPKSAP